MAETFEINAVSRSDTGKGASRRLRHSGKVPGIIYGAGKDPEMITVDHNELVLHLENEAFYSHILKVSVDGNAQKVVLKDLQRHPAKPFIVHLDLLRVSADEKLKMLVPLHFIGEDVAPGVKAGGTPSHTMTEVEVSCLPGDLPEYIEVDASALEIGDIVHLTDLVLPEGVELTALQQEGDHDASVMTIMVARAAKEVSEEEEEAVPEEGAEEEEGGEE